MNTESTELCLQSASIILLSCFSVRADRQQYEDLHKVVSFLLVPTKCYHSFIKRHFEWNEHDKVPCNNMCSFCLHETNFTGPIRREQLTSVLCATLQMKNSSISPDSLKAAITAKKKDIFTDTFKSAGPIHALMLQLFANGVIKFIIAESKLIGTDKLSTKHVSMGLVYGNDSAGLCKPVYEMDECWRGIHIS